VLQLLTDCKHITLALPFKRDEVVVRTIGRPDQLIKFELDGLSVPILRRLHQEHHHEGHHAGDRIDDELPSFIKAKKRAA